MEPAGPEHLARVRLASLAATRTAVESHLAASLGEFPPKSAKFGKGKQSKALDSVTTPYSTLDCESDPKKHALLIQFKSPDACQFTVVPRKHVNIPIASAIAGWAQKRLAELLGGINIFRSLETGAMRFTAEYFWVIISRKKKLALALSLTLLRVASVREDSLTFGVN